MKKIVFLTGTRADYGKIKQIMKLIEQSEEFKLCIFVTGMHMHKLYGDTFKEIQKDAFSNLHFFINQQHGTPMDIILSNTIVGFSNYVKEEKPDLIVLHGDRLEALAGVIVGAMNNILVAHIEGGEVSGTIDESIRHAITKMAHVHFVANEEAKKRIIQLGERESSTYVIGSPDIDIMLHGELPSLAKARNRYEIGFEEYGIVMFHPITTSHNNMSLYANQLVDALLESGRQYIVIQPNNDLGREHISEAYLRLAAYQNFRIFPSIRFEYFLTLLKNASCVIGNSSAGVREANVYSVPAVDIGDRQKNRYSKLLEGIVNVSYDKKEIVKAIDSLWSKSIQRRSEHGTGNSAEQFLKTIKSPLFWSIDIQKHFVDID